MKAIDFINTVFKKDNTTPKKEEVKVVKKVSKRR